MKTKKHKLEVSGVARNFMHSCVGIACLSVVVACGGNVEGTTTTAVCYDANGFPYNSIDAAQVQRSGCYDEDGKFNQELTNKLSSTTTNPSTTSIERSANWVTGDSMDIFVAPFVQAVCDTLRGWKAPAETTKNEFTDFEKQVASLKEMIGSPSEPSFSDTYWKILILAAEALDYERRHPNDKYPAFTLSYGPDECDRLNFTSDNSSFGIDVNDPEP